MMPCSVICVSNKALNEAKERPDPGLRRCWPPVGALSRAIPATKGSGAEPLCAHISLPNLTPVTDLLRGPPFSLLSMAKVTTRSQTQYEMSPYQNTLIISQAHYLSLSHLHLFQRMAQCLQNCHSNTNEATPDSVRDASQPDCVSAVLLPWQPVKPLRVHRHLKSYQQVTDRRVCVCVLCCGVAAAAPLSADTHTYD